MSINHVRPWRTIERRKSRQITVGSVAIGGDAPISVQTMTNTDTTDVKATVKQITAPASAAAVICLTVALTSVVSVLVMVWTEIGASPPIATLPTIICRDFRLSIVRHGRTWLIDILIPKCCEITYHKAKP